MKKIIVCLTLAAFATIGAQAGEECASKTKVAAKSACSAEVQVKNEAKASCPMQVKASCSEKAGCDGKAVAKNKSQRTAKGGRLVAQR
jgi:hypothetical protein